MFLLFQERRSGGGLRRRLPITAQAEGPLRGPSRNLQKPDPKLDRALSQTLGARDDVRSSNVSSSRSRHSSQDARWRSNSAAFVSDNLSASRLSMSFRSRWAPRRSLVNGLRKLTN